MGVLTFQIFFARFPAAIVIDVRTPFRVIKIAKRRSSEVLLSMSVIAVTPFVLLVNTRTK
jgi:hypothetical protein